MIERNSVKSLTSRQCNRSVQESTVPSLNSSLLFYLRRQASRMMNMRREMSFINGRGVIFLQSKADNALE